VGTLKAPSPVCLQVAQSMGLLFSIAIKNVNVALTIAPVIVLMLMILGGFYIPFDNIPFFVRWLNHFSFAKCGPDPPAPAPCIFPLPAVTLVK
jgi:ABC-type multidrug transport system permease subunit